MILNFTYICQSVCLLSFLPKLDKGIYPELNDVSFWIFLKTFLDIGTLVPNNSKFFVCLSAW